MELSANESAVIGDIEPASLPRPKVSNELLAFRDAAFRFAVRMTGNAVDADDIVQEAYLRLLKSPQEVRPGAEARTLLLRIVANLARNRSVSEHRRQTRERKVSGNQLPDGEGACARNDLSSALERAVKSLPENVRLPVTLHYEQGLSYADASRILNVPEDTLRVYAQRGVQLLRSRLAREGFAVSPAILVGLLSGTNGLTGTISTCALKAISKSQWKVGHVLAMVALSTGLLYAGAQCLRTSPTPPQSSAPTSVSDGNLNAATAPLPASDPIVAGQPVLLAVDGIIAGDGSGHAGKDLHYSHCRKGEQWRIVGSVLRPTGESQLVEGKLHSANTVASFTIYDSNNRVRVDLKDQPASVHYVFQGTMANVVVPMQWEGKSACLTLMLTPPSEKSPSRVQIEVMSMVGAGPELTHAELFHSGPLNGSITFNR